MRKEKTKTKKTHARPSAPSFPSALRFVLSPSNPRLPRLQHSLFPSFNVGYDWLKRSFFWSAIGYKLIKFLKRRLIGLFPSQTNLFWQWLYRQFYYQRSFARAAPAARSTVAVAACQPATLARPPTHAPNPPARKRTPSCSLSCFFLWKKKKEGEQQEEKRHKASTSTPKPFSNAFFN